MKVLVCGSRDWMDRDAIAEVLSRYPAGTEVLHGTAAGADRLADSVARMYGLTVRRFPADWERYSKRAGKPALRNVEMLDQLTAPSLLMPSDDHVIAFQRNGSRGTQHTIDEAQRRGIPVEVHRC